MEREELSKLRASVVLTRYWKSSQLEFLTISESKTYLYGLYGGPEGRGKVNAEFLDIHHGKKLGLWPVSEEY